MFGVGRRRLAGLQDREAREAAIGRGLAASREG
jgi:hypothetical protein